jgi:hypothetical protein
MKENFYLQKNLNQLKEQMEQHEPYAVMVVSTTGLEEEDMPLRVQIKQYEYDENTKQYLHYNDAHFDTDKGMSFDSFIEVPKELIEQRTKEVAEGGYDVFKKAGIDNVEAFQNGVPMDAITYSADVFKKAFENIVKSFEKDNTLLIVNGLTNAEKALEKIGCSFESFKEREKIVDQVELSKEYVNKDGKQLSVKLEDLAEILEPLPRLAKETFADEKTKEDYSNMSKSDFLSAHNTVSERTYDTYTRRTEFVATERLRIMNKMVTSYGVEQGILPNSMEQMRRNNAEKQKQTLSENGMRKYENANVKSKVDFFVQKGYINPDEIRNRTGEFEKLGKALTRADASKPDICFFHVATTSREKENMPLRIQAKVYGITSTSKGVTTVNLKKSIAELDQIIPSMSSKVLGAMNKDDKNVYSGFRDAHLPIEEYMKGLDGEGKPLPTIDEAVANISQFFNSEMLEKCNIIVSGGQNFYKESLNQVSTLELCDKDFINLTQAIQEYAYGKCNEEMFNSDTRQRVSKLPHLDISELQTFRLPDLAKTIRGIGTKEFGDTPDLAEKLEINSQLARALGCEYSLEYLDEVKERVQNHAKKESKQEEKNEQPQEKTKEDNKQLLIDDNQIQKESVFESSQNQATVEQATVETEEEPQVSQTQNQSPIENDEYDEDGSFDYDDIETVTDEDVEQERPQDVQEVQEQESNDVSKDEAVQTAEKDVQEENTKDTTPNVNDFYEVNSNNNTEKLAETVKKVADKEVEKESNKGDKEVRRSRTLSENRISKSSERQAKNLIPEPKSEQSDKDSAIIAHLTKENERISEQYNNLSEQYDKVIQQNSMLMQQIFKLSEEIAKMHEKDTQIIQNMTQEQNAMMRGMLIASNPEIASVLKETMEVKKDDVEEKKDEEPSME